MMSLRILVCFLSRFDRSGAPDCSNPLDRSDKPADKPGRSRQKMAENGGISRTKKRHFPCLEPVPQTQAVDLAAFMSADLFGAREQENCRAPFSGENLFDVTRHGRARPDAMFPSFPSFPSVPK